MKKRHGTVSGDAATDLFDDNTAMHETSFDGKALYFAPGPYRWARYLLYPEEAVGPAMSWLVGALKALPNYLSSTPTETEQPADTCNSENDDSRTCSAKVTDGDINTDGDSAEDEDREHMAIAAQYYRKAAEDHKSARANFNLGFMYEWGLGLNQDFPLAKRHYDLAGEEADIAASLALFAMGIHEKVLKLSTRYWNN